MTNGMATFIVALGIVALIVWIFSSKRGVIAPPSGDVDAETLAEAEREVRDLDAFTGPDEADDQLPDWGPGAPKDR